MQLCGTVAGQKPSQAWVFWGNKALLHALSQSRSLSQPLTAVGLLAFLCKPWQGRGEERQNSCILQSGIRKNIPGSYPYSATWAVQTSKHQASLLPSLSSCRGVPEQPSSRAPHHSTDTWCTPCRSVPSTGTQKPSFPREQLHRRCIFIASHKRPGEEKIA